MDELEEFARQGNDLHNTVMGGLGASLRSYQSFHKSVAEGKHSIVVTLRWGKGIHQLVLRELREELAFFYNPVGDRTLLPGTSLGGADGTPLRSVVSPGVESIPSKLLMDLFDRGEAIAHCF